MNVKKSSDRDVPEWLDYEPGVKIELDLQAVSGFSALRRCVVNDDAHRVEIQNDRHLIVLFDRDSISTGNAWIDGRHVTGPRRLDFGIDYLPPGRLFVGEAAPGSVHRCTMLDISVDATGCEDARLLSLEPAFNFTGGMACRMMEHIVSVIRDTNTRGFYLDSMAIALLAELERLQSAPSKQARKLTPLQRDRLVEYVEAGLSSAIRLTDLAALCGYDVFRFTRAFQQTFGASPYQYVIERRIARAKTLLARQSNAIADVASASGFTSASQFSRTFRQHVGVSPRMFRSNFF